jgi:hypothetical protein
MPYRLPIALLVLALLACARPAPELVSDAGPVHAVPVAGAPSVAAAPEPWRDAGRPVSMRRARRGQPLDGGAPKMRASAPPDDRVMACTRTATDKASLMACLDALKTVAPFAPDAGVHKLGATRPPVVNPAWSVPDWYVHASTGNDANTCVTSGAPCKTFGELRGRWETDEPQIPVAVTIHVLADTTESLIWRPQILPGGSATILGSTTTTASGTLATVHAKTPSSTTPLLSANISPNASGAQGLLIVNSTHPGVAWVDSVAGSVATFTQPMLANVPGFTIFETEVNTWANGDSYTLQRPVQMRVAAFEPTTFQNAGGLDGYFAFVGHVWATDPTGTPGQTLSSLSHLVRLTESRFDTFVTYSDATPAFDGTVQNSWMAGSGIFVPTLIQAGAFGTLGGTATFSGNEDFDTIFHGGLLIIGQPFGPQGSIMGPTYTDGRIYVSFDTAIIGDLSASGSIYGNGSGSVAIYNDEAVVAYVAPAATTFLNTAITCDFQAFAGTRDRTVQGGPFISARALSAAALDTAVASGGFGGLALCDNGGEYYDRTQATSTATTYTPALCPIDLTTCVTNTLAVGHGGTGDTTGTAHATALWEGTSPMAAAGPCSTDIALVGITGSDPHCGIVGTGGGGTARSVLTAHDVLLGGSPVQFAAPTATSGVPLISQGASADPIFGTATVPGGGTGITSCNNEQLVEGTATSTLMQCVNLTGDLFQNPTTPGDFIVIGLRGLNLPIETGIGTVPTYNTGSSGLLAWSTPAVTSVFAARASATVTTTVNDLNTATITVGTGQKANIQIMFDFGPNTDCTTCSDNMVYGDGINSGTTFTTSLQVTIPPNTGVTGIDGRTAATFVGQTSTTGSVVVHALAQVPSGASISNPVGATILLTLSN